MDSVKEFLLSIQQQSALTNFNDSFGSLTTTTPLIDFSGLCRLELKVNIYYIRNEMSHSL
jgi:hypothetical protein